MKFFKLFGMLMISATLMLTSCGKDENNGTCSDGIKNQDETDIDCGGACQACIVGLQGKWNSYPVAPILTSFADSIVAECKTNSTYLVKSYKDGLATDLVGTYVQTASGVGNIWTITVNQTSPSTLTSEGIFEVSADRKSMKYEVAQTTPPIAGVTPPTAVGGLGSTSGGAFGQANVQNYTAK